MYQVSIAGKLFLEALLIYVWESKKWKLKIAMLKIFLIQKYVYKT